MTTDPLTLLAAVTVGTIATARAVRLITSDTFPPTLALRVWWLNVTEVRGAGTWRAPWSELATCPFCFAPYAAAVNLTWALLAGLTWGPVWSTAWWVVNLWAAVAYVASMLVVRDEPAPVDH